MDIQLTDINQEQKQPFLKPENRMPSLHEGLFISIYYIKNMLILNVLNVIQFSKIKISKKKIFKFSQKYVYKSYIIKIIKQLKDLYFKFKSFKLK